MFGSGSNVPDGKHMAEEDALRQLKKILAQDWMKKYTESPENMQEASSEGESPMMEGLEELGEKATGEKDADDAGESDESESPDDKGGLRDELMKYMKPQVKERRPGTALMIAVEKKMSPMKKRDEEKGGE